MTDGLPGKRFQGNGADEVGELGEVRELEEVREFPVQDSAMELSGEIPLDNPDLDWEQGESGSSKTRLGLALSGGGFRATLYHLGVIRCLRDAGVLPKITHITTVSGGSILGAHMVLNWDRYCGTPEQFDAAAAEVIRFVQLDVRNRIVRRFPFGAIANRVRSMLLMGQRRQWTRAGLLERYYQRFLYGDTALSQLPEYPRLHILSTCLSEGCLCSFNRNGLLRQRRIAGRRDHLEHIPGGLATVPMAVSASSCFPGFFPPLELTGWDVGADIGQFARQTFTDGGVYDNLGLRMFRLLEQSWVQQGVRLHQNDFVALDDAMAAFHTAKDLPEGTPLRRLRELVSVHVSDVDGAGGPEAEKFRKAMINGLWEVIRSEKLYRDPILINVELDDPSAQSLQSYLADSRREPSVGDSLWLNRMIVDSALRQVIGKPCLRHGRHSFDGILVSDAGGKFKVNRESRGGGLIKTALRSSDILMDRVWQLESEVFENTAGVVFIPITEMVDPASDPTALDPEVQRQASRIRTDLDYFSELEISSLVQHGYSVARQICRRNSDLVDGEVPVGRPWDPMAASTYAGSGITAEGVAATREDGLATARKLRDSSKRKVMTTLLSLRDWPSYIWLVLVLGIAVGAPTFVLRRSERLDQQETVLEAVAQLNPNYDKIVSLLRNEDLPPFHPMEYEDVATMEEPDLSGFEVISESRVYDLRNWEDMESDVPAYGYTRTQVQRLKDATNNASMMLQREMRSPDLLVECGPKSLMPTLSRMDAGDDLYRWQLHYDFSRVPLNSTAFLTSRSVLPKEMASVFSDEGRFNFRVRVTTGLLQIWLLMPEDRQYGAFEVSSHPIGQPELSEIVVPAAVVRVAMESVATFRLINPEPDRQYECRWKWAP